MTTRERRVQRAQWLVGRDLAELGADLRSARLAAGLSLRSVATAAGVSPQSVLRCERPVAFTPDVAMLAGIASAVGLRVRIRAYPEGAPLRDAAQIALIRAFRARLGPSAPPVTVEQPASATPGDLRAFDGRVDIDGGCVLEFITRFHDCQAQLRSALLKQRDAGALRLVLVVKATHANRRALAAAIDVVEATFPVRGRAALAALRAGRVLAGNAIVLI